MNQTLVFATLAVTLGVVWLIQLAVLPVPAWIGITLIIVTSALIGLVVCHVMVFDPGGGG